ncbi:MAG: hemerythrin domain-containing protein [Chitinophagaceae bacterium]
MSTQKLSKIPVMFIATNYQKTEPLLTKEMKTTSSPDLDKWDLDNLTDYIITTHHSYAKKNAAIIYELIQEVANRHSEKHPELLKLTEVSFLFFHDLLNHMAKEEQILFPNINILFKKKDYKGITTYTTFGLIREAVFALQKEHLAAEEDLKLFHKLTNDYNLPEDACNSYKYLFMKMKEFENDLVLHINLENNILFPKAIALDGIIERLK